MPKFDFPKEFDVTYTKNYWSNFDKCVDPFESIIFPCLREKKKELGYLTEQYCLVIMDTFKGRDNDAIKALCNKNLCELVIVPHNLTNKFQPLELTINKKAKKFISNKFNKWYAEKVSKELRLGKAAGDVKVSLKLSELKPLHARWIVKMYDFLKHEKASIVKGFEKAGILESVQSAQQVYSRCENPFEEKRL